MTYYQSGRVAGLSPFAGIQGVTGDTGGSHVHKISEMIHRRCARRALAVGLIMALGGCSHPTGTSSGVAAVGAGTTAPAARVPLALSRSTYEVTMKPDARVIDAATMSRAYRGTGADGALKFDAASAPDIAALKPGTVTVFAGTALLKVTRVESSGARSRSPARAPASRTPSITATSPGPRRSTSTGWRSIRRRASIASWQIRTPSFALQNVMGSAGAGRASSGTNTWNGIVKDWDVTIALTPTGGNLHLDLHATK